MPATRLLGAADYKLVHHASNGRSVYSFCMCPGGTVVAATSEPGRRRDQRHEPILAQRAKCQCRHRGRYRSERLPTDPAAFAFALGEGAGLQPRPDRHPIRWPASCCSGSWSRRPMCWAAAPMRRQANGWEILAGRASTELGSVSPILQTGGSPDRPGPGLAAAMRSRRSGRPCLPLARRSRVLTWATQY
jgi:hypothetical protein